MGTTGSRTRRGCGCRRLFRSELLLGVNEQGRGSRRGPSCAETIFRLRATEEDLCDEYIDIAKVDDPEDRGDIRPCISGEEPRDEQVDVGEIEEPKRRRDVRAVAGRVELVDADIDLYAVGIVAIGDAGAPSRSVAGRLTVPSPVSIAGEVETSRRSMLGEFESRSSTFYGMTL